MTGVESKRGLREPVYRVPPVIRRNTILLAISQALVGSGMQLVPALGPVMVVQMLGSATMAGVGTSLSGVSRLLIAYPLGLMMDAYGRRGALILGLSLGMMGAAITAWSAFLGSFPLFVLGILVFGLGSGAAQQLRVAAADMYPASLRAKGLGYVLSGATVGAIGGPVIIFAAQAISGATDLSSVFLAWLIVPVFVLPSIMLVSRMRPDPKDIARSLGRYYAGYVAAQPQATQDLPSVRFRDFLKSYPRLVAFVCCFSVWGNMSMLMAMTSLVLHHYGHSLTAISVSVAIHVLGMYSLSLPIGALGDRLGRRKLLLAGIVTAGAGALLVPISSQYVVITLGTFLVGLGWSCVNVGATAVIADATAPAERGRAIGTNDTFSGAASIVLPLIAGPLAEYVGLNAIGILGVLLMVPPFFLLLRLKESAPGRYG